MEWTEIGICINARTHSDDSGDQESFIQIVLKYMRSMVENISYHFIPTFYHTLQSGLDEI